MNKYVVAFLLLFITPLSHAIGTYSLDPFDLSLKGPLFEPYSEYHVLLKLNKENGAIRFLEISIDGK